MRRPAHRQLLFDAGDDRLDGAAAVCATGRRLRAGAASVGNGDAMRAVCVWRGDIYTIKTLLWYCRW